MVAVSPTRGPYEGGGQERDLAAKYLAWAQARRFEYPFVGKIIDAIAEGCERDAALMDTDVRVRATSGALRRNHDAWRASACVDWEWHD